MIHPSNILFVHWLSFAMPCFLSFICSSILHFDIYHKKGAALFFLNKTDIMMRASPQKMKLKAKKKKAGRIKEPEAVVKGLVQTKSVRQTDTRLLLCATRSSRRKKASTQGSQQRQRSRTGSIITGGESHASNL